MKIRYFYKIIEGNHYPWAESDLLCNGIDLLELLLSSDLSSSTRMEQFNNTVFTNGNDWWFNSTKVQIEGATVRISPAFDISASASIEINRLKKILTDWEFFLKTGKEIDVAYD